MSSLPTWSPPPTSYHSLITLYTNQFNDSIARGEFQPFVWPYRSFGVYLTLLYLLIPPTKSRIVFHARYPVFAFLVYWSVKAIRECRSAAVAPGYGNGLMNGWAILWMGSLIVFNDARGEFRRIEEVERVEGGGEGGGEGEGKERGCAMKESVDGQGLRNRHLNGSASKDVGSTLGSGDINGEAPAASDHSKPRYAWQSLHPSFPRRLNWVCDLVSNFRGLGWSHQVFSVPSPPASILSTLQPSPHPTPATLPTGISRYPTPRAVIRKALLTLALGYLACDILKVVMMYDPYFWGVLSSPPPSYLPALIRTSSVLMRIYRLVLSASGAYVALQCIFALAAPFFVGIFGRRNLGLRAEPWQYPDHFGSYIVVFRKGLAGWWGAWWHQTFRFAFEAPQKWAVRKLGWEERGMKAKVLGLVVAFTCSGCLHAAGSYTMWPSTRSLKGPFTFFVLQPVGIVLQMGASRAMERVGIRKMLPGWVRGVGNFVLVHVWFYYTAPFLTDDFARGGVWLFEPIPVSPLRGMGFGAEGEGWWCWKGRLVGWYWGEKWWQSGVAF